MFKLSRVGEDKPLRRVCVVGIGGGGCRALRHIQTGENGPRLAAVSTDTQALADAGDVTKILLGATDAGGGIGTGGDAGVGRQMAENEIEMLRGLFSDAEVAFLVVCQGGGTGSGISPVVARAAHEFGVFTIVLTTMPFGFEGEERRRTAEQGVQELSREADVVGVIENDRLFGTLGDGDIKAVFARADEILAAGIDGIWQMLAQPAFIGIDLADLSNLVEQRGGNAIFGFGRGSGVDRVKDVCREILEGPVFDKGNLLRGSSSALVCVVGGADTRLSEAGDIMAAISRAVPDDCNLRMGTVINDEWAARLLVLVFVTERKRVVRSTPGGKVVAAGSRPAKGRRRRKKDPQDKLKMDPLNKGRFKDVESTIMDGQDLDVPTFMRLGIDINIER